MHWRNEEQEQQETVMRFEELSTERQERVRSIVELRRRGLPNATIAKLVNISEATLYRDIQLIRDLNSARVTYLDVKEEMGDALNIYDEIANKALEGHRSAIEDNEKLGPDHSQAARYLLAALASKKAKVDVISGAVVGQALDRFLKPSGGTADVIDVSLLKNPNEMNRIALELQREALDSERLIFMMEGPNPFDYEDKDFYKIDQAKHMEKFD